MKVIKTIEDDQGRHWKLVQEGEYIYLKNHFTYCIGKGKELFSIVAGSICEYWSIRFDDISLDECFDTENYSTAENIIALTMSDGANIKHRGWIINAHKKGKYIMASNEHKTESHRIGFSGNGIVILYPEAEKIDIRSGVFIKGKEIK